jgi:hypothetical protein
LIVAIGAHRFTGVTLADVDDILTGLAAPKIKFQFDASDPHIGSETVNMAPIPPRVWPEGLAGLLWIDNELPFPATIRPNPTSDRPIPAALLPAA